MERPDMQQAKENQSKLLILQTSDIHGQILPHHYAANEPIDAGLAKLASLIRKERRHAEMVLIIDNGDLIQGTPLAYFHARMNNETMDPAVTALNALQYDAAVIGNHEFNYGHSVLKKAIRESQFPWLSANTVCAKSGEPFFGKPYIIKSFPNGLRAAVLGLTTQYIPNWEQPENIEGIAFLDVVETARRWVPLLREQADVVIVAYHGGFERDAASGEWLEPDTGENQADALCCEVPGIDVLLTGHQHRQLAGIHRRGTAFVQPGVQGQALSKIEVMLESDSAGKWAIAGKRAELLSVQGVQPDSVVLELVEEEERAVQAWLDQPIGKVTGNMLAGDRMQMRLADNALIEFINHVQMDVAGAAISNTALFDNMAPGFGATVTMRDVVSNYIYPNTLKVIRVTGKDIRDALERSAGYFERYTGTGDVQVSPNFGQPKPQHYNYDMWEGIEYELNISRPEGQRVTRLERQGKPLDLEAEYDVVMNHYRAGGGGNYDMFRGKPIVKDIPTEVAELLAEYIMRKGTIEAKVNHNWRVVWD